MADDIFDRLMALWQEPWSELAFGEAQMLVARLRVVLDARPYVPTPEELDDLCAAIGRSSYASDAVFVVEEWTRKRWGVESAFTTANP